MNKRLSFAGPSITQLEVDAVSDAVLNGWYETYDKDILALEKTAREYLNIPYAKATFCCTHALHLACLVLGLKEGDEVICPDISWAATANCIRYVGANPVFVDIKEDTWCIDPEKIKEAITHKTKAVMIVHTFGMPCEMDVIKKICEDNELYLIEDAAPAIGSKYKGQLVGTFGDIGCFSFHGAKLTASGEGGLFVCKDRKLYDKALLLGGMGRTNSQANFWCDVLGYEFPISNITAALANAQLTRVSELIAIKRRIFERYQSNLAGVEGITLIKEPNSDYYSNYCYPAAILETIVPREKVFSQLCKLNIHARAAFPRMSQFPYMQGFSRTDINPVSTRVAKYGINLPSAANLTMEDIDYVSRELQRIIR